MGFGLRVTKLVLNTCLPDLRVLAGWPSTSLWEVEVVSTYHPGISVETVHVWTWTVNMKTHICGFLLGFCHYTYGMREKKEGGKDVKWKGLYIFLSFYYVPAAVPISLKNIWVHTGGVIILEFTSRFTTKAHGSEGTCTRWHSSDVIGSWVQLTLNVMLFLPILPFRTTSWSITAIYGKAMTYIF